MGISRLFLSCTALLWLVTAPEAAFERPAFPSAPLDAAFRPTVNPATLGDLRGLCGGIRHDRPFGLPALSGHGLLLAAPLSRRLALGLGAARRGPDQHREYVAWMGLGVRLAAPLSVGLAARRLAWRNATGNGRTAISLSVGGRLTLAGSWALTGAVQQDTDISPGRASLRLVRGDATGAVAADLSARRGRRALPAATMVTRLDKRLTLSGQVRSLADAIGAGATLHGALDLHVRVDGHPVLGRSWTSWLGRPCR